MKKLPTFITAMALSLLSACQSGGATNTQGNSAAIRYSCKGASVQDFRIVFSGDKAQTAVMSSSQRKQAVVLTLTETASGAKYLGSDNVEFWSKGDQAMIEWPRGMHGECTQIK